ncbi:MAG: septum formation initiator [Bacteroidetes bacterium]|nr:MAG: septum formation initiator [Bacteroidota bacterium]
MKVIRFLLRFVKNKYVITLTALAVWLLFFDKNDLFTQIDLTRQVNKMQEDTLYYSKEIKRNREDLKNLESNPEYVEKFVRENYLMKRDSEDIYIFVEKQNP